MQPDSELILQKFHLVGIQFVCLFVCVSLCTICLHMWMRVCRACVCCSVNPPATSPTQIHTYQPLH